MGNIKKISFHEFLPKPEIQVSDMYPIRHYVSCVFKEVGSLMQVFLYVPEKNIYINISV